MTGFQMPLFDRGEDVPSSEVLNNRVRVLAAYDDAMKYGHGAAVRAENYEVLCARLVGYADAVAFHLELDASEKKMLRNYAFSAADPIMLAKQH